MLVNDAMTGRGPLATMRCDGDVEDAERTMMTKNPKQERASSNGHCDRRWEQEEPLELLLDLDFHLNLDLNLGTINNVLLRAPLDPCLGREAHNGICFDIVIGPRASLYGRALR